MIRAPLLCALGRVTASILWLVLGGIAFAAKAQEGPGDLAAGHALAHDVCLLCHEIERDPQPRILDIAPDFRTIAETPGITATALSAFLLTSHPKMPNIILSKEESSDVVTYILSLKKGR
jgi:mono/diheme cytochrome c family protein